MTEGSRKYHVMDQERYICDCGTVSKKVLENYRKWLRSAFTIFPFALRFLVFLFLNNFIFFIFNMNVTIEGVEEMLFEGTRETRQTSKIIKVSYV